MMRKFVRKQTRRKINALHKNSKKRKQEMNHADKDDDEDSYFNEFVIEWNCQELDFRPDDMDDEIYAVSNIPDPISVEESVYDDEQFHPNHVRLHVVALVAS